MPAHASTDTRNYEKSILNSLAASLRQSHAGGSLRMPKIFRAFFRHQRSQDGLRFRSARKALVGLAGLSSIARNFAWDAGSRKKVR